MVAFSLLDVAVESVTDRLCYFISCVAPDLCARPAVLSLRIALLFIELFRHAPSTSVTC
jgi:hypothetical protein